MENEKELVELIKKGLASHEEKYVEGAWENFVNKQRQHKRVLYWRVTSGVAASLILGLTLLISLDNKVPEVIKPVSAIVVPTDNDAKGVQGKKVREGRVTSVARKVRSLKINEVQKLIAENIVSEKIDVEETTAMISASEDSGKVEVVEKSIDKPNFEDSDRVIRRRTGDDKLRFGLNLSPGFNSTSSGKSFNYSGGFNIDIALLPSLFLSTGIQIEHQRVELGNSVTYAAIPFDHMSAELTNLDIPINITWKFLSRRSGSKGENYYVSGGISSITYVGEKYSKTSYRNEVQEDYTIMGNESAMTYKLENVEKTSVTREDPFSTFDVAGRVNLIFGVEKQLAPNLYLHIEPYVKIPLSGLGSANMKFVTSGITCKISF